MRNNKQPFITLNTYEKVCVVKPAKKLYALSRL